MKWPACGGMRDPPAEFVLPTRCRGGHPGGCGVATGPAAVSPNRPAGPGCRPLPAGPTPSTLPRRLRPVKNRAVACRTLAPGGWPRLRPWAGGRADNATIRAKLAMNDRKLAINPVVSDRRAARIKPGVARIVSHGSVENDRAPRAGNQPIAGSTVPEMPAASGTATVSPRTSSAIWDKRSGPGAIAALPCRLDRRHP